MAVDEFGAKRACEGLSRLPQREMPSGSVLDRRSAMRSRSPADSPVDGTELAHSESSAVADAVRSGSSVKWVP